MRIQMYAVAVVIAGAMLPGTASAVEISNGSGDGNLQIDVDLFGSNGYAESVSEFGDDFNAVFDPVGALGPSDPIFASEVFITQGSFLTALGLAADVGPTLVSQSSNSVQSAFSVNQLDFHLTQTVSDAVNSGQLSGSVLTQNCAITNTTDVPNVFSLVRYMDGDLYFNDETLEDGGGVLRTGDQVVLYQTDASGNVPDSDTFLGITASGGTQPAGIYDIAACCGVNNFALTNTVEGDTDGDGFIDSPYDVTLALARDFSIAPGETQTFSTQTLFGNSAPVAPGDSENLPLLPDSSDMVGGVPVFFFDIPVIEPGEIIWIDPVVAIGYIYEVTGARLRKSLRHHW